VIVADFVDEGAGATVIDSEMRRMNLQPCVDATNDVLAIPTADEPIEISYAPEGACILGSTRNFRAKDDAVDDIERHVARPTIHNAQVQFFGVTGLAVPRLASIRAVGNIEIGQINLQDAFFKVLLTFNNPIPFKPPPSHLPPAEFAEKLYAIWAEEPEGARDARRRDYEQVGQGLRG